MSAGDLILSFLFTWSIGLAAPAIMRFAIYRRALLSSEAMAWAAGIIDGEGSIALQKKPTGYELFLIVSNTSVVLLQKLQQVLGGKTYPCRNRCPDRHRPAWQWKLSGRYAQAALKMLMPYLTAKAPQAAVALIFPIGNRSGLPPLAHILRDLCWQWIRKYNRQGRPA